MRTRNIRLLIAFDGSCYSGWQRQENAPTIQATIEERLAVMTGRDVTLHGAGRTDAGVHALGMAANFTTEASIPCSGFLNGLNSMLPKDIRIIDTQEMESDFHSRYSATGKTYGYTFFTGSVQLPTERLYTAHYPGHFASKPVQQALKTIQGTHDFTSFEATGSRDRDRQGGRAGIRTVFRAELTRVTEKDDTWKFSITGDGFLRHMVRNLAGTLMEVGSSRISPDDFTAILRSLNRESAGPTAPACGLVLEKVHYSPLALSGENR